jgi:hypothetical protein
MDSISVDSSPLLGYNEEGVSLFYPKKKQETTQEEAERKKRVDFERHRLASMNNPISLENLDEAAREVAERKHRRETSGAEQEVDFQFPRDSLDRKIVNEDGSPYLPEIQIGRNNPTHETNLGFSETTEDRPDGDYWYTNEDKRKAKEQKRKEAKGEKWSMDNVNGDKKSRCGKCTILGGKKTKRRRYTRKYTKRHRSRKSRKNKKSSKNNKK